MDVCEQIPSIALATVRRESNFSTTSNESDDLADRRCSVASVASSSAADGKHLLSVEDAHSTHDSCLSDCRDSGVEADTFTPPDDLTGQRIAEAVEYYFSNENLLKDAFLLKHVKRNKEGFVSLKLISSFKRVKHLSRDWRVVAFAMRFSEQLEVNENGSKVRRLQPLPDHDETITSRTVVAVNLPLDNPTIASVSELFAQCGDIASIRVLKPGCSIPVDVRAAFNKNPDVAWEGVNCAVVEFDKHEQAQSAKETLGCPDPTDWSGMHILPIGKVSNKKKSRQEEQKVVVQEQEIVLTSNSSEDNQKKRRQRRKKPLVHMDSHSSMSGTDGECGGYGVYSVRRVTPPQGFPLLAHPPPHLPLQRLKRISPPSRPGGTTLFPYTDIRLAVVDHHIGNKGKSHSSPNVLPSNGPAGRQKKSNSFSGVPPTGGPDQCPWVLKRKASGLLDPERRGSLVSQENVQREPRGPDGGRGFAAARGPRRSSQTSQLRPTAPAWVPASVSAQASAAPAAVTPAPTASAAAESAAPLAPANPPVTVSPTLAPAPAAAPAVAPAPTETPPTAPAPAPIATPSPAAAPTVTLALVPAPAVAPPVASVPSPVPASAPASPAAPASVQAASVSAHSIPSTAPDPVPAVVPASTPAPVVPPSTISSNTSTCSPTPTTTGATTVLKNDPVPTKPAEA